MSVRCRCVNVYISLLSGLCSYCLKYFFIKYSLGFEKTNHSKVLVFSESWKS